MKFSLIALTACCVVAGPCFAVQADDPGARPPEFTATNAAGVTAPALKPADDAAVPSQSSPRGQ